MTLSYTFIMEQALPSELNAGSQGYGLEVQRDKLTFTYKAEARHSSDVGAIQADRPAPLNALLYYFELTVLERGDQGRIAIGFTDRNFKLTKQPGWVGDMKVPTCISNAGMKGAGEPTGTCCPMQNPGCFK